MSITMSKARGFPDELRQAIQMGSFAGNRMGRYGVVPVLPPPSGTLQPWRGYSGFAEASEPPSRALWFVLGAVTVLIGPAILNVVMAGGDRAARRIRG